MRKRTKGVKTKGVRVKLNMNLYFLNEVQIPPIYLTKLS
jgi:hypothetical protein